LQKPIVSSAVSSACAAPTTATSHSPDRSDPQARCIAVNEDEQAVSTTMLGPRKSNAYDTRLAAIELAVPELAWPSMRSRFDGHIWMSP